MVKGSTLSLAVSFFTLLVILLFLYWLHELALLDKAINSHEKKGEDRQTFHQDNGNMSTVVSLHRPKRRNIFTSLPRLFAVFLYGFFVLADVIFVSTCLLIWLPSAMTKYYDGLYGDRDNIEIRNITDAINEDTLSIQYFYLYLGLTSISLLTPFKRIYIIERIIQMAS